MSDKLYRFAYRFLQDSDTTKDAIQDVFIKLWSQRNRLVGLNSLEAFAIRVTRNHCLDMIKSRRTVSMDENDYLKDRIADDSNPEKELYRSDSYRRLTGIINALPEPHRSVIRMKDLDGYSNEEIGDSLGLSEGNVRVVLSRARKKVREEIEKVYDHGNQGSKSLVAESL